MHSALQVAQNHVLRIRPRQRPLLLFEDRPQQPVLEILDPPCPDRMLAIRQDDHLVGAKPPGLVLGQQVALLVAFRHVDAGERTLADGLGFRGHAMGGLADGGRQFGLGPLLGRGQIDLEARATLQRQARVLAIDLVQGRDGLGDDRQMPAIGA